MCRGAFGLLFRLRIINTVKKTGTVVLSLDCSQSVSDKITEYGIKHTTNGVIQTLSKQPKIISVVEIGEGDVQKYIKAMTK